MSRKRAKKLLLNLSGKPLHGHSVYERLTAILDYTSGCPLDVYSVVYWGGRVGGAMLV